MPTVNDKHYYQSFAKELDSKLGRINSLINNHPGEKGNYHEYILKNLISNYLPSRYSVKTGFIYVDDTHVSPQIDLMIIDESQSPCFLAQYNDFVVTYPEAVCCVIEVKTTLEIEEFKESTNLIQLVKNLSQYNNPKGEVIGGLIFGFGGTRFRPKTLDNWYKNKIECDFTEYPEAILSLKTGLILKHHLNTAYEGHYFITGESDSLKWKSLSIFMAIIIKFCELRSGVERPEGKNAFERFSLIRDLMLSAEFLRYKIGLQTRSKK